MATTTCRNCAAVLMLLLLCLSTAPAGVAARKLLASAASEPPPPPLIIKVKGCFGSGTLPVTIAADIAAVDAYAADNGRQRLTFAGGVRNLTAELGSFDMLIVYTAFCGSYVPVFKAAEQAAVATALATGTLKKLMVWHGKNLEWFDNHVPGASNIGCSDYGLTSHSISANPDLYGRRVSPSQPSSEETNGAGLSFGFCPASRVQELDQAVAHAWTRDNPSHITAFSYCYEGRGAVFYSQMAMNYFLYPVPGATYLANQNRFHTNALSVFSNDISCAGPPTCPADVVLSDTWLPPNNKMFDVSLITVPLQDPALPAGDVNVRVNSVEFFDVLKGRRPTFPLAVISPNSSVVSLRAQRNGAGSGRLYRIKYTAANAVGSCSGVAFVCVPHDASALVNATTAADLAAAGQTASPEEAPKATCPIPSKIEEWMPTTGP